MTKYRTNVVAGTILVAIIGADTALAQEQAYSAPTVVQAVAPVYPAMASTSGISGTVVVEVLVDHGGSVVSDRMVEGHQLLRAAAGKAAHAWVFSPAEDWSATRSARLTFVFELIRGDAARNLFSVFLPPYTVRVRGAPPTIRALINSDPPIRKRYHARSKKRRSRRPRSGPAESQSR